MALDADPEVVRVAAQPMWLRWTAESGRSVRHAPDYFARRADGTGVVIDVRADERIGEQDAAVFAATGRLSAPVGWEYQWVWGARRGACGQLALAVRLPSSPVRPAGADGLAGRGVRASGAAAGRGGRGGGPGSGAAGAVRDVVACELAAELERDLLGPATLVHARGGCAGGRRDSAAVRLAGCAGGDCQCWRHDRLEIAWVTVALRGLRVRADAWARVDSPHREAHRRL
jgi:hypothetical protein